jgi:hypothetical protein
MNGVRVRGVRLTNPKIVKYESKKFEGRVCWRGVTEAFRFEMNGAGPFLHRRILFSSSLDWEFQEIECVKVGAAASEWKRSPCVSLEDSKMCSELKRLFGVEATVRDVLYSRVAAHGVSVIEDKRKSMKGDAAGVRRFKKYWNGFGKNRSGKVVKYEVDDDGRVGDDLCDEGKFQNVYVLDIFQYGINGLDFLLPTVAPNLKKRPLEDDGSSSKKKKAKSETTDLDMGDLNLSDYGSGSGGMESALEGVVRIYSEMRLYWYDPK